jgi:hypothetical protein
LGTQVLRRGFVVAEDERTGEEALVDEEFTEIDWREGKNLTLKATPVKKGAKKVRAPPGCWQRRRAACTVQGCMQCAGLRALCRAACTVVAQVPACTKGLNDGPPKRSCWQYLRKLLI